MENLITRPQDWTLQDSFNRNRHGSLYDRGSADAYYGRGRDPHWYPKGTGYEPRITDLTPEQVAEYTKGYEEETDRKDWG